MQTRHRIFFQSSTQMDLIGDESIDLMVTSPPYPMIEMWDRIFSELDPGIGQALRHEDGKLACELMHRQLDMVWSEVFRVLKPGGIICVNIGDATRKLDNNFQLYPNHARILHYLKTLGLYDLPTILWRKQTNAPNKFMGSGMLPPNAYVTLEHEYILVLRKGNIRAFKSDESIGRRRESAYFWEERNHWFSDIWMDIKGDRQTLSDPNLRKRSGAFRFSIPYRLINMFSIKGDTVLDPFLGLGTTMLAAAASGRNSVGYEIADELAPHIDSQMTALTGYANHEISTRINNHVAFVKQRLADKKVFKHRNVHYGFPVITGQERWLLFNLLASSQKCAETEYEVSYELQPHCVFSDDMAGVDETPKKGKKTKARTVGPDPVQLKMF
ncbi:MAG: site-specific DNA-methyltransferase [Desulfobacteraceae bacterium]|nr:site-specific DNA-methyltransferase [Desulfobacteraceae bacterium]